MRHTHHISQQMWDDGGYDFACDECGATENILGYRAQDGSIFVLCEEHCELSDDCSVVGEAA